MTPQDVKEKYQNGYRFYKATGMAANSFRNWLQQGFVPELSQYKLEIITKGELKSDWTVARENNQK